MLQLSKMRLAAVALSGASLLSHGLGYATPVGSGSTAQVLLGDLTGTAPQSETTQQLHGRFLHITGTVLHAFASEMCGSVLTRFRPPSGPLL